MLIAGILVGPAGIGRLQSELLGPGILSASFSRRSSAFAAVQRLLLVFATEEQALLLYAVRAAGFLLIIGAIIDKNRSAS